MARALGLHDDIQPAVLTRVAAAFQSLRNLAGERRVLDLSGRGTIAHPVPPDAPVPAGVAPGLIRAELLLVHTALGVYERLQLGGLRIHDTPAGGEQPAADSVHRNDP